MSMKKTDLEKNLAKKLDGRMKSGAAPQRFGQGSTMFLRALLAFLTLPGVVAFAVPVVWLVATSHTQLVQPLGLVPLVVGCVALFWCARDFYVSGKGTIAPWAPTLPKAYFKTCSEARRQLSWQFIFPSKNTFHEPRTGHIHADS